MKSRLGVLLNTNPITKVLEILLVFTPALIAIILLEPIAGDSLIGQQAVIWVANVAMLVLVWLGLRLRGEDCRHFGLTFKRLTWKEALKMFGLSLVVLVIAVLGFVFGSILMANITGIPESTDLSNYAYLQDNPGMLVLTLCGVYLVSSFGEEVVYRGFLINRISELGLRTKSATVVAVLVSAVIFGLAHYSWGPMGIVQTGFMGLALGICYVKLKKRLWILILAHAYMDTILMLQLYLA